MRILIRAWTTRGIPFLFIVFNYVIVTLDEGSTIGIETLLSFNELLLEVQVVREHVLFLLIFFRFLELSTLFLSQGLLGCEAIALILQSSGMSHWEAAICNQSVWLLRSLTLISETC